VITDQLRQYIYVILHHVNVLYVEGDQMLPVLLRLLFTVAKRDAGHVCGCRNDRREGGGGYRFGNSDRSGRYDDRGRHDDRGYGRYDDRNRYRDDDRDRGRRDDFDRGRYDRDRGNIANGVNL